MACASLRALAMTTILIADDEEPILELVRFTLEEPGIRVLEAHDGAAAIELAEKNPPDLALLDVRMPHVDGLEVCRRLRAIPGCAQTRIVILSAAGQD